jgi:hypothetical protein
MQGSKEAGLSGRMKYTVCGSMESRINEVFLLGYSSIKGNHNTMIIAPMALLIKEKRGGIIRLSLKLLRPCEDFG